MGINANVKDLIQALSVNDIQKAKTCALCVLANDKTNSTAGWRKRMQDALENQDLQFTVDNLPWQVKELVFVEDVGKTFMPGRYYVSNSERALLDRIKQMHVASAKLDELRIRYLNSTLLHGVSGTGKTMFGRMVAYECGLPFVYLTLSIIVDSLLGSTSKNLSAVFDWVRSTPCVFMLDEIDAVSTNRGSSGFNDSAGKEFSRITITLIQELDRIPNDVILLGATNRLDCVDDAVIRRFQHQHEMRVFDRQDSVAMVKMFLDDVGLEYDRESVEGYADKIHFKDVPQARIMSHVVRSIADACVGDHPIIL